MKRTEIIRGLQKKQIEIKIKYLSIILRKILLKDQNNVN